ncbi:MAG: hypothetical protein NC411_01345 [Bacteroides sp.]|nr:hypothetical protein [Bacteroides sp.]
MNGWIKISRELPNHWIWKDADRLKWWLDLLFMASWEDTKQLVGSRLIEIKRGQLIASISFLSKRWGVGHNTVISFLKVLQEEKMIEKTSEKNVSTVTILNFDKFQAADNLLCGITINESEVIKPNGNEREDSLADNIADNRERHFCQNGADNLSNNLSRLSAIYSIATPTSGEDSLADNIADNPADTSKEIYNNINISTTTRTRESFEKFEAELLADTQFWEGAAMSQYTSIEILKGLLPVFINEKFALGEVPKSFSDFRRHFFSWARIALSKQQRTQNNDTKSQNKYSKRRGVDSEARSAEDYTGEV